jgi:hypothetical protein
VSSPGSSDAALYGRRIRGFFRATSTGDHVFTLESSSSSRLSIGDVDGIGLIEIARTPNSDSELSNVTTSHEQMLEKDRDYLLDVIFVGSAPTDDVTVGVQFPDKTAHQPIQISDGDMYIDERTQHDAAHYTQTPRRVSISRSPTIYTQIVAAEQMAQAACVGPTTSHAALRSAKSSVRTMMAASASNSAQTASATCPAPVSRVHRMMSGWCECVKLEAGKRMSSSQYPCTLIALH